ncbi:protein prib [Fusarium flagelliforme]|uniref:Protein prib n=1 Tax=Fusarium flagelliforme TaxID=2675880 RepID=A0A395ML99_9HYPO|nr:protein prib [Fusarium flagelliforme]
MSGFEIAGVVLGLFPIVCDTAKDLSGVFRDAQSWWRFEREFEDFILEIEKQQIAFSQILEILFDPLHQLSLTEREALESQPNSPLWFDLRIQAVLRDRIRQKYLGWFMRQLGDINDALKELLGLLPIEKAYHLDSSSLESAMFRIKTSFSHRKNELLARIEARNKDLYEFLERASHVQHSRVSTPTAPKGSAKIVSSFLEFQEQAKTIFSGFQRHWACSCNCNGLHSCSISAQGSDLKALFDNGTETRHVKVEIEVKAKPPDVEKVSPSSNGATSQEAVDNLRHQVTIKNKSKSLSAFSNPGNVETGSNCDKGLERPTEKLKKSIKRQTVRFDSPPPPNVTTTTLPSITSRCDQPIEDVCLAIKKQTQESCLGFLKLPGENLFLHADPPGRTQLLKKQTLEEFMNATPRRASRLELGMAVATTVLKLGPSWVPESWQKSSLVLLQTPDSVPQPYISHPSIQTASPSSSAKTKATLLALGIMLLELLFCDTLERQPFRADYLGNGGQPNDMTDFCTAMKWQKKVEQDFGDKLAHAIESCVKCAFEPVADLSPNMEVPGDKNLQHQVACFSCRASRQKCDRQDPCSRCSMHDRVCKYPARSNRGRKHGSTNVDKLLSRIEESGAREEIIAALLNTSLPSPNTTVSIRGTPWTQAQRSRDTSQPRPDTPEEDECEKPEDLISPLSIVTTAIATNTSAQCEKLRSQMPMQPGMREAIMAPIKERLGAYFSSQRAQQKDWDVLATQSVDCPFKLEKVTCDPLASRLIDDSDAAVYFQLFFQTRNPLVGLLDATLHTFEYVYANSFTLFSVICALGCAMSARPRDRAIYPVLINLANGNVRWSIAAAVKSLSTIQAIVNMQYWAPVSARQVDDTSSLCLSHAIQLAREMGIDRADVIREYVNSECEDQSPEFKKRCIRNYERTWLRTLIADKGFGIMNGRLNSVNWKDIPRSATEWWKSSLAEPTDRMLSGIIEIRRLLLSQVDKRKQTSTPTPSSILEWHKEAYDTLTRLRNERCTPDETPSAKSLPVLAFYMDLSILVLNAQALRDIDAAVAIDNSASEALLNIERKSIEVASRALHSLGTDKTMIELALGFQNNQYLMICHAMTEILRAIKRGALTTEEISTAAEKVISVIPLLDNIVQLLPSSSAAHLYFDLARFFACQIDSLMGASDPQEMRETIDSGMFTNDWFKSMDMGMPDVYTMLDMGYLGVESMMVDTDNFLGLDDLGSIG